MLQMQNLRKKINFMMTQFLIEDTWIKVKTMKKLHMYINKRKQRITNM